MNNDYTYEQLFERNNGVFNNEEINKIKSLKVGIVGAGGLGGPVAYTLARLGVGEIRIIDPEKFEASNINRQYGAYIDTIGQYKAKVIERELLRINPYLVVKAWGEALTPQNLNEFIEGVNVIVDAIDFFAIEIERLLYKEAVKRNLWCHTSQAAGNICTFTSFNPQGMTFDEMFLEDGNVKLEKIIKALFPILPDQATPQLLQEIIDGKQLHISSHATPPPIGGSLVVEDIIRVNIKNQKPIAEAPNLYIFDLNKMAITHYKVK